MIQKDSLLAVVRPVALHLFVRGAILLLRLVAPACFVYVGYVTVNGHLDEIWLRALYFYAIIETAFFFCIFWPLRNHLQDPATHPEQLSKEDRDLLLKRCSDTITDPEVYLQNWFHGSALGQIRRENLKEFLLWAFWGTTNADDVSKEELDDCVTSLESTFGQRIVPGRGTAKSLRVTMDEVGAIHRPLIWYMVVGLLDTISAVRLRTSGYVYYREPLPNALMTFPIRAQSLLTSNVSASPRIPYWYKPHTSKTRLPIVFLHGIGLGVYPYGHFLKEISNLEDEQGGQIGVLVLEFLAISSRLTSPLPLNQDLCKQILDILDSHGWDKFVLVANSYGSIVSTQLFRDPKIGPRIGPMLLVDPVTFLLHLPDVAHNFVARQPKKTMEHILWYFASKDPMVAHTLQRRTFWVENIIWKEELEGRDVTIALAANDDIVNAEAVKKYLVGEKTWKSNSSWRGNGLDLLWFEDHAHAEMFQHDRDRKVMVAVIEEYCKKDRSS